MDKAPDRNGDRPWSALIVTTVLSAIVVPGGLLVAIPYLLHSRLAFVEFDLGAFRVLGFVPIIVGTVVLAWCTGGFVVVGKGRRIRSILRDSWSRAASIEW